MSAECMKCGTSLFGEIERDTGICGSCADRECERHAANREWEHFHRDCDCSDPDINWLDGRCWCPSCGNRWLLTGEQMKAYWKDQSQRPDEEPKAMSGTSKPHQEPDTP